MSVSKRQKIATQDKSDGNVPCDLPRINKGIETWREAAMSNIERNKYALKEGILSDVTFAVGPSKRLFHCHKTILSLASPVFEAMFFGSLKETCEVITITDLMPAGFQLLLDYIYTDDMKLKNESDAFAAWIAGDKYCLPYMKDICYRFLSDLPVTDNNVWIILENSLFLNSESLEDKCWNYLKKNVSNAIESPSFLDVSQDVIKKLLLMDSLCIKELSLTLGVVNWVKEQIKNGSEGSMQDLLQPFLGYIRFGCMSQAEFVRFIDEYKDIISDSDALSILKFMTDDLLYSLPEWCSKNVHSRQASSRRAFSKQTIAAYSLKPKRSDNAKRNHSPEVDRESRSYHHPDDPIYHGYRSYFEDDSRNVIPDSTDDESDNDNLMFENFADSDSHSAPTSVISLTSDDTDHYSDLESVDSEL